MPRSSRLLPALTSLPLAVLLGACSGAVEVDVPDTDGPTREACTELLDALPGTLLGQDRVDVDPAEAPARAWGDPAVVLTCGVPAPVTDPDHLGCSIVEEVQWRLPGDSELKDADADVVVTTIGHDPVVQVAVPAEDRQRFADIAHELSAALTEHTEITQECI